MGGKSASQWISLMDTNPNVAKKRDDNLGNLKDISQIFFYVSQKCITSTDDQFVLKCQQHHMTAPRQDCICDTFFPPIGSNQRSVLAVLWSYWSRASSPGGLRRFFSSIGHWVMPPGLSSSFFLSMLPVSIRYFFSLSKKVCVKGEIIFLTKQNTNRNTFENLFGERVKNKEPEEALVIVPSLGRSSPQPILLGSKTHGACRCPESLAARLIPASGRGQMCQSLLGLAAFSPPWLPVPTYPAEVQ